MKSWKALLWFLVYIGSFLVGDIRWLEWAPWAAAACMWSVALCFFIDVLLPDKTEAKQKILQRYRDGEHLPAALDLLFYCMLFAVLFDSGWYFTFGVTIAGALFDFVLRERAKEKAKGEA